MVLINDATNVAYWAELTPTTLISTGNHYKVLVPESQAVTVECEELLREVLLRSQVRLSGYRSTAWIRPGECWHDQGDELVAAMLTPRLVAPHPNIIRTPDIAMLTPTQAIALVSAGRVAELEVNLENHTTPGLSDLAAAAAHPEWRWRFAAALSELDSSSGALEALVASAESELERIAAGVALACCIARTRDVVAATAVCAAHTPARRGFARAWMLVQHARFARLDNDRETAISVLAEAVPDLALDQRPWPTALLAAARVAQLNLGLAATANVQLVVEAADTPATWWTAQARASVLDAHLDNAITQFAPPGSFRAVFEDVAHSREGGLMLSADLAGDQGRFVHEQKLGGRRLAVEAPDSPEHLAAAIRRLRAAGDATNVSHLAHRLLQLGAHDTLAGMWRDPSDASRWRRPATAATVNLVRAQLSVIPQPDVDAFAETLRDAFAIHQGFHAVDHNSAVDLATSTVSVASTGVGLELFDAVVNHNLAILDEHPHLDEPPRTIARLASHLHRDQLGERHDTLVQIAEQRFSAEYRRMIAETLTVLDSPDAFRILEETAAVGDTTAVEFLTAHGRPPPNATSVLLDQIERAIARAEHFTRPGNPSHVPHGGCARRPHP